MRFAASSTTLLSRPAFARGASNALRRSPGNELQPGSALRSQSPCREQSAAYVCVSSRPDHPPIVTPAAHQVGARSPNTPVDRRRRSIPDARQETVVACATVVPDHLLGIIVGTPEAAVLVQVV